MITSTVYEITLEEWLKENDIYPNKKIPISFYEEKNVHFSSYDSWKLSSRDDYYNEKEIYYLLDINELMEYLFNAWESENCPDGADEIYSIFDYAYENFLKEKKEEEIKEYRSVCSEYER